MGHGGSRALLNHHGLLLVSASSDNYTFAVQIVSILLCERSFVLHVLLVPLDSVHMGFPLYLHNN